MARVKAEIWEAEKVIDITFVSPGENLLTPADVPTSEPATPQFSYAVNSAHFPTSTLPFAVKVYILYLLAAGKNTTAGAITVYWRMVKWNPGTSTWDSVATGSASVAANNYYTINANFYNVVAGEQYGIKIWAGATGVNYDYNYRFIHWTRLSWKQGSCHGKLTVTVAQVGDATQGTPGFGGIQMNRLYPYDANYDAFRPAEPGTYSAPYFYEGLSYLNRFTYGDLTVSNTGEIVTHATYRPYQRVLRQFTKIVIRTLKRENKL